MINDWSILVRWESIRWLSISMFLVEDSSDFRLLSGMTDVWLVCLIGLNVIVGGVYCIPNLCFDLFSIRHRNDSSRKLDSDSRLLFHSEIITSKTTQQIRIASVSWSSITDGREGKEAGTVDTRINRAFIVHRSNWTTHNKSTDWTPNSQTTIEVDRTEWRIQQDDFLTHSLPSAQCPLVDWLLTVALSHYCHCQSSISPLAFRESSRVESGERQLASASGNRQLPLFFLLLLFSRLFVCCFCCCCCFVYSFLFVFLSFVLFCIFRDVRQSRCSSIWSLIQNCTRRRFRYTKQLFIYYT